jgi:hypothetical protein
MHDQLVGAISPNAKDIDVAIEYERGDADSFLYANEIARVFADSGVRPMSLDANSWLTSGAFGLAISTGAVVNPSPIVEAFEAAGMSP